MKKIILTGGLGHIGSRIIRDFPSREGEVEFVILDNLSTQRYCSLFNLPKKFRHQFLEMDVHKDNLGPVFDGASLVIHLAAITNAAGSFEIREKIEHENFLGTKRVGEACLERRVPLINLSSTSVYGTQKEIVDEDCSEEDLKPQSPYAETKLREESLLSQMHKEKGLRFVTCRFGTIFGISPGMRFHTAVNKFCWQAVMNQPITVWTTAFDQVRPYLDLEDAVRALHFIFSKNLFNGEIYNVLTVNATVRTIVETIKESVPNLEVKFVDTAIMNQLSYHVSDAKFRREGFEFRGDLRRGIRETISQLPSFSPERET